MRVAHEVVVERSPAEVFAYLTDLGRLPEWQAGVTEVRVPPGGPAAAGTTFTQVLTFAGRRIETDVEVTELEPDSRFSLRVVSGPVPIEIRHALEPAGGGTRIRVAAEGEPRGALRLAAGMVQRQAKQQLEASFARLKSVLESG